MAQNYYVVWKQLNLFLIKLDVIPDSWEERVALFAAYLIDIKKERSYISAIKHVLKCDKYKWCDNKVWLNALIRACKIESLFWNVYIRQFLVLHIMA